MCQFSVNIFKHENEGRGKEMKKFRVKNYGWTRSKFVVEGRENGKRRRKFFENKAEAEAYAVLKNIEMRNQGVEGAEFDSRLRVMAQEGAEKLKPYGKTIADAAEFYCRHLEASQRSCSVAQLVDELLKAKKTDGASKRHLLDLGSRLTKFALKFHGQAVATITTMQIDDWLRSLEVAPITRNNFRRVLVGMFNFAMQRGYAIDNPAEKAAKARVISEAPGILTVQQTARLLEAASPELLPVVAIGAFAGLRRAELERLDWRDVHFDADLIEVTAAKAKTARRRFVKMQPNLREWLLPLRKHTGRVAPVNLRKTFERARVNAGIKEWPDNALRHSFASYHLAQFKDQNSLALEMGHTDVDIIFNHYRQLVKPTDAERYWNIQPAAAGKKIVPLVAHT
jgi:integrase